MTRTKVLLITPVFPPARGGIETLSREIVEGFSDLDVRVLTADQQGAPSWDAASPLAVTRVRNEPRGGRKTQARLTAAAVAQAVRFGPDVVISMEVRCGAAAAIVRSLTGASWVQYWHAKEIVRWPRQARWAARSADAHIAVSRHTAGLASRAGAPAERLHVVPPGIHNGRHGRSRSAGGPTPPRILTVSRMEDAYKGHDVMLDAIPRVLAAVPDAEWIVVGDGRLRAGLEEEARVRGLGEAVTFLGWVSEEARNDLLESARVFAMPSRIPADDIGGEGFGIVYLEAASRGLPCVAGNEGGAVDAVKDGETGFLVDPRSDTAVAAGLVRLLSDSRLHDRFAAASRDWAATFDWALLHPRIREIVLA